MTEKSFISGTRAKNSRRLLVVSCKFCGVVRSHVFGRYGSYPTTDRESRTTYYRLLISDF